MRQPEPEHLNKDQEQPKEKKRKKPAWEINQPMESIEEKWRVGGKPSATNIFFFASLDPSIPEPPN